MTPTVLDAARAAWHSAVDDMSASDVRRELCDVRRLVAMASARLISLERRLSHLAHDPAALVRVDPDSELRSFGGLRPHETRSLHVQAVATEAAPQMQRLLEAGATTAAHVESLGRTLESLSSSGHAARHDLLAHSERIAQSAATMRFAEFDRWIKRLARQCEPDEGLDRFERQRRSTHLRISHSSDGMVRVDGAFDPERGAILVNAIERRTEAMFHSGDREVPVTVPPGVEPNDHRRALALLDLCRSETSAPAPATPAARPARSARSARSAAAGPSANSERRSSSGRATPGLDRRPALAEVVVHVDLRTLVAGLHAHSVCRTQTGGDIPPHTARRLACDASIIPVVLGGDSIVLDVGRARRLATVHQRRAFEAMYATCAIPDCEVRFAHCTIHHIEYWEAGGRTDMANMVPLCSRHHHAVHEGGWRLHLEPGTRLLTVT